MRIARAERADLDRTVASRHLPGQRASSASKTDKVDSTSRARLTVAASARMVDASGPSRPASRSARSGASSSGPSVAACGALGRGEQQQRGPGLVEVGEQDSEVARLMELLPEVPVMTTRTVQRPHVDFDVPDLDVGEEQVLALGARKADVQPGTTFRVYLDPAGHPVLSRAR